MAHWQELLVAVAVVLVTFVGLSKWQEYLRYARAVRQHGCKPGTRYPNRDPILGLDLFRILRKADDAGQRSNAYMVLHEKYGATFEMKACSAVNVQTAHPENLQAICATNFDDFGVEPMRGRIGAPFMDHGIFMVDGEYWKHSRAMIRPTFSRAEIADLTNFERYVALLLALIPKDGESFDLLPLSKRLFLDTSTEFIFGKSIESLSAKGAAEEETTEFMKAFDRSLLGLALTFILGPLKFLVYIDPGWIKAYKKVHAFVDKRVQQALDHRQKPVQLMNSDGSERSKYILVHEMTAHTQDPYELRNQLINIFFPARDTAAIAFGNIVFLLARHPTEWEKLRREVLALGPSPNLTFELIRSLKVTKSIINEAIRLHPAASRIGRVALRDTVLPRGGGRDGLAPLFVPKHRVLEMDLYTIQRDRSVWGPDADEFRPDRWTEGRPLWETKWQYEPFLGGIRMCPAQNQVLTQVGYLLVRFAQEFERIECRDTVQEYVEKIAMTVESRNGVKIALWRDRQRAMV